MATDYFERFTFLCEIYCEEQDRIEERLLHFFPVDNSVQVNDLTKSRVTLQRIIMPSVRLEHLKMGNIINIFGKLYLVKDCSPRTRSDLFQNLESTFALIKPLDPSIQGKVITYILQKGFRILKMKNGLVTKEFVQKMYDNLRGIHNMPLIVNYLTSGEVIGMELEAPNAVSKWRECLGHRDPQMAASNTLRKLFGSSVLYNVAHGCDSAENAKKISEAFFGTTASRSLVPFRATYKDCTCCIIKPHAVIDGNIGKILEDISHSGKFKITALAMFSISYVNALEFYEIYKGVLSEYEKMATQLAQGKCVVLEVKLEDPSIGNVVEEFRKLCGPRNPVVCQQLYPNSLRAKYGCDTVLNAVHCTDLPEDGELEVEYFFKLLGSEL